MHAIELCCIRCKKLVQETATDMQVSCASRLAQGSCTGFMTVCHQHYSMLCQSRRLNLWTSLQQDLTSWMPSSSPTNSIKTLKEYHIYMHTYSTAHGIRMLWSPTSWMSHHQLSGESKLPSIIVSGRESTMACHWLHSQSSDMERSCLDWQGTSYGPPGNGWVRATSGKIGQILAARLTGLLEEYCWPQTPTASHLFITQVSRLMLWLQLRLDYNTTTMYHVRLLPFHAIHVNFLL